ncbi:hypothetical protein INT48_005108 [Thamnidium elegans]|uniref:Uncharacterized protein n=1 Tax=Thamnidium elegans TaxID=101142 RepID=A0A8H7W1E9_9FUNG|nr:hypothetical protein INT48_005108 [Thamnidium elegans]
MEEPAFQPIITLFDAVTDSPVYRSSVYRYDEQLELLEQWLDSLSRHLKLYTERLNKLNLETVSLCQKAIPQGIDETLIDPNFTGAVMNSFTDALQTSLSFKSKLVSNLEECLISPIQQFVKTHLKEFKAFRKQHEKALEQYESQLLKYSNIHKTKEPSSIREEAFRLHETRKEYVKMSGQHVLRILNFRSLLEHCLVERFSAATLAQRDFYNDIQLWANLDAALAYWKQWLEDDKFTCSYQLHQQQIARKRLEEEYIKLTAPDHELEKYIPTITSEQSDVALANSKWGYLFVRVSRHSWVRKWFFIHSGYFGSCQLGSNKRSIIIDTRYKLSEGDLTVFADTDRRFCFQISFAQSSYILQAETEQTMQDWITTFTRNKNDMGIVRSPSLRIKSKSSPTTALSSPASSSSPKIIQDSSSSFSNISSISVNQQSTLAIAEGSLTLSKNYSDQGSSIVMVSTTPDAEASLENSSSLTPLLVWEAARITSTSAKKLPSSSWGIPCALVPTMVNLTQDTHTAHESAPPDLPQVIWPAKPVLVDIPKITVAGYTDKMNAQNRELRRLFSGVQSQEVVLDVFGGCLRKKATRDTLTAQEIESAKSSLNWPGADAYENQLVNQLSKAGLDSPSSFGYAYTGRGFITQDTFWFYSCILMSCINTVAIRLKDIDEIKVVKDASLSSLSTEATRSMNSDLVIAIYLLRNEKNEIQKPIIIGTMMDDIDMPMQIRNIYNKIASLSSSLSSHKSVVLDVPLTFNSAIKSVPSQSTTKLFNKRPHAATVGQESKVNASSILKSNRQRGDSEPMRVTPIEKKKKAVVEAPKPVEDPDMPPSHIHVPKGPVECNCDDHLEKETEQATLPISAKRCYELLFSNEKTAPPSTGGVWEKKTNAIEGHDLTVTKWSMSDGKMQRTLKYWMPVSNPIVRMKEAEVVETQVLINKEEYIRYTVQISTKTAALPYADAFIPCVRYCITWVSKSECQLSVYLGVKWVKSVLVRAIVTRAALKGMTDSIGLFVPIIKSVAESIKDNSKEPKLLVQAGSSIAESSLHGGMDSVVEEDNDEAESVHFADYDQVIETNQAMSPPANITPAVSYSSKVERSQPVKPEAVVVNTQKRPKQHARSVSTNTAKEIKLSDYIVDLVSSHLIPTATVVLFIFTMYMMIVWYRSSSRMMQESKGNLQHNTSAPEVNYRVETRPVKKSKSRSVYIRDLDEGFLKNTILPPYAKSESYQLFLNTKNESNDQDNEIYNSHWYSVEHYRLAIDLDISRERIAMLRHDMLVIFQVLNKIDSQLVESEYTNWLLDTRLKCKYYPSLPEQDSRSEKSVVLCNDIKTQLDRLF